MRAEHPVHILKTLPFEVQRLLFVAWVSQLMYKVTSIGSHAAPSCHLLLHVFAKFIPSSCKHSEAPYCTAVLISNTQIIKQKKESDPVTKYSIKNTSLIVSSLFALFLQVYHVKKNLHRFLESFYLIISFHTVGKFTLNLTYAYAHVSNARINLT